MVTLVAAVHAETPAEQAAALVAEGEALGKAGKYDQALERFRRAEDLHPSAMHDCYIAIALARQKSFSRARFYLDRCKSRSSVDPPVTWFAAAYEQVVVGTIDHGSLTIVLPEEAAGARVGVTGYEDVPLEPGGTIWLPEGRHRFVVRHPDFEAATREVEVIAADARTESVAMVPRVVTARPRAEKAAVPPTITSRRPMPVLVYAALGATGATLVGAISFHINASMARKAANRANDRDEFDSRLDDFRLNRNVALGLYAVSAIGASVGGYLLLRHLQVPERDHFSVSVAAHPSGLALGWQGTFE